MASATKSKTSRRKAIEAVVTVTKFTDTSRPFTVVRDQTSLAEYVPIDDSDYLALGHNTPLRDALARFVAHLEDLRRPDRVVIGLMVDESGSMSGNEAAVIQGINDFVAGMSDVEKVDPKTAGTVLAVYATDGLENASREISPEALGTLVGKCEKDGFTFIGLGAKIDAWSQGASLGFSGGVSGQAVSYRNTPKGTYAAMASVTTDAQGYLGDPVAYSQHRTGSTMRSVTEDGTETLSNINAPTNVGSGAPNVTVQNFDFGAGTPYADVKEAIEKAKKVTS